MMHENEVAPGHAMASVEVASLPWAVGQAGAQPIVEALKELIQAAFSWLALSRSTG